jgi:predicted nucleic acid-binding protein
VIHLDTGVAIHASRAGSPSAQAIRQWLGNRTPLAMSALAWGELLCGSLLPAEERFLRAALGTIVPVEAAHVELAAQLFNETRRRRGSFADCLIAATAIVAGATLATTSVADFEAMRPHGLALEPIDA